MAAIGLFALRMLIARPLVSRVRGTRLRSVSIAFFVAAAIALVATPVYVDISTAEFALRSAFSVGALVPLMRVLVRPRDARRGALRRALRRSPGSRSGWTGPSGPAARSPGCSRSSARPRRRGGPRPSGPGRPRCPDAPAGWSLRSTGSTRSRARSGSAASPACSSSGPRCRRPAGWPGWSSASPASRTSPSSQ